MKMRRRTMNTTLDVLSSALHKSYVAQICGSGQILPIEERVGKKLLKTINPVSKRGKELLAEQKVTFHLPDGKRLSAASPSQVFLKLREITLEKVKKCPKDKYHEEHFHAVMEQIMQWEKLYCSE
jgi:hypothetical protein